MATYASEVLNSDDYRNSIKDAMENDCRHEDEHDGFENFSSDSDHWLVIAEMLEKKDYLITELVGALEAIYEADNTGPVAHEINEKGKAVNWHNTKGRSAEIARAALTKAKESTK